MWLTWTVVNLDVVATIRATPMIICGVTIDHGRISRVCRISEADHEERISVSRVSFGDSDRKCRTFDNQHHDHFDALGARPQGQSAVDGSDA
jgi:hypothetical protein